MLAEVTSTYDGYVEPVTTTLYAIIICNMTGEFVPAKDTFELSKVLGVMISIPKKANHCAVSIDGESHYLSWTR